MSNLLVGVNDSERVFFIFYLSISKPTKNYVIFDKKSSAREEFVIFPIFTSVWQSLHIL